MSASLSREGLAIGQILAVNPPFKNGTFVVEGFWVEKNLAEETGFEVPAGGVVVCVLLLAMLVQDMVWKGLASLDLCSEGLRIEAKLMEHDPPA